MKIEVTRDDIDNAVLADCQNPFLQRPLNEHCPIAQAFKRLFPTAVKIDVAYRSATVDSLCFAISRKDEEAMLSFTWIMLPEEWLIRCKPTTLEFDEHRP